MARGAAVVLATAAAVAGCASDGGGPGGGSARSDTAITAIAPDDVAPAPRLADGEHHLDLRPSGNRWLEGPAAMTTGEPAAVAVRGTPRWVLPLGEATGASAWVVVLADGGAVVVDSAGRSREVGRIGDGTLTASDVSPDDVPLTAAVEAGRLVLRMVTDRDRFGREPLPFADPLPDGRVVAEGGRSWILGGPTDRYGHGVLGDAIEASTLEMVDDGAAAARRIAGFEAPDVIEGVAPIVAEIDDRAGADALVTVSNGDTGARLVVVNAAGTVVAESEPIGRGNRWRNQLAVAPVGPAGEIEIVDVRTPHLNGTVEFFRVDGDRLVEVARREGFTNHALGSRNLDEGIVIDANGDGRLEVVVPTLDRLTLGVLQRDDGPSGVAEIARLALPGPLTTNVAARRRPDGAADVAAGTADGTLLVWTAPPDGT